MVQQVYVHQPDSYFFDSLKSMADIVDNKYVFNRVTFKRSLMNGNFNEWVSSIYDLVIKSKQKYLSQIENVNQYITVIRQFLKAMDISYIYKSNVVRGQRHPELILT
jgi:hypothetical protein